MKNLKLIPVFICVLLLVSCDAVRVYSDFDKNIDFSQFKTYAFYKTGIDKAEISDLDKKRILRSIDNEMQRKGFTKSETPDLLINIFTKEKQQVDVNQFNMGWGYGWGMGWNPWMWGGNNGMVNSYTEGTLFIDLIDAKKKEMVWQGEGLGNLTKDTNRKDEVINEFVTRILGQYPPTIKK